MYQRAMAIATEDDECLETRHILSVLKIEMNQSVLMSVQVGRSPQSHISYDHSLHTCKLHHTYDRSGFTRC